ncbi:MAG: HAMP domain-containing histidine kinase [Alphaproteobacteria bacterium]|nr:HAMP domain-containing histidine kinase [Alphaproteobacteria bacterium]
MMAKEWINSAGARTVLGLSLDPRPAWLWDGSGENLVWRNVSAVVFRGVAKKHGLRPFKLPVPIKGQVQRVIRLGAIGRSSLSRIRFLAGKKPLSLTCSCTPLIIGGKTMALISALEPVDTTLLKGAPWQEALAANMFSEPVSYLFADGAGNILGVPRETAMGFKRKLLKKLARQAISGTTDETGPASVLLPPTGARLIFAGSEPIITVEPETTAGPGSAQTEKPAETSPPRTDNVPAPGNETDTSPAPGPDKPELLGLGALVDRLAARLKDQSSTPARQAPAVGSNRPSEPITEIDHPARREDKNEPEEEKITRYIYFVDARGATAVKDRNGEALDPEIVEELQARLTRRDYLAVEFVFDGADIQAIACFDRNGQCTGWRLFGAVDVPEQAPEPGSADDELWVVRGRGLVDGNDGPPAPDPTPVQTPTPPLHESVKAIEERTAELEKKHDSTGNSDPVSRYNFDELSRLLGERIRGDDRDGKIKPPAPGPAETSATGKSRKTDDPGALVTLSDETLVLNRLSLGLLIFRDQSLLFANRAIAELVGYSSSGALRAVGFTNLFRPVGPGKNSVGPVTELIGRDGRVVPVHARLQSIVWQGSPALLLSAQPAASPAIGSGGTESAGEALELVAAEAGDGFIRLDSNGTINRVSDRAERLLGPAADALLGRPLLGLLSAGGRKRLAGFMLEAAFDQAITVAAETGPNPVDITLVARRGGQGDIAGFWGLVRSSTGLEPRSKPADDDRALGPLLAQLGRELRGPLNTVLGFSELVGDAKTGELAASRVAEYARDIHRAGREIHTLLTELGELSRLADSQFKLNDTEIDLRLLLEACAARIRPEANKQRVVVRSAVSEKLPRILADGTVLTQTIMNLLASAVSLARPGSQVVLSAQVERDGAIGINVRDTAAAGPYDPAEGFVIFREPDGAPEWARAPLRSRIGLAVTQSLARANAFSLTLDPLGAAGTLISLEIPARKTISS